VCTGEEVRLIAVLGMELDVDSNARAWTVVDGEEKDTGDGTWEIIEDIKHKDANARDSPMG